MLGTKFHLSMTIIKEFVNYDQIRYWIYRPDHVIQVFNFGGLISYIESSQFKGRSGKKCLIQIATRLVNLI